MPSAKFPAPLRVTVPTTEAVPLPICSDAFDRLMALDLLPLLPAAVWCAEIVSAPPPVLMVELLMLTAVALAVDCVALASKVPPLVVTTALLRFTEPEVLVDACRLTLNAPPDPI